MIGIIPFQLVFYVEENHVGNFVVRHKDEEKYYFEEVSITEADKKCQDLNSVYNLGFEAGLRFSPEFLQEYLKDVI